MENEKLLWDIESELEIFQAHVKRMRKNSDKLHTLDVELLQEKTRKLYDKLIDLKASTDKKPKIPAVREVKEEKLSEPEVTIEDTLLEEKVEPKAVEEHVTSEEVAKEPLAKDKQKQDSLQNEIEEKAVEQEIPEVIFEEPETVEPEIQPEEIVEEKMEVEKPIPVAANNPTEKESVSEKRAVVKSTIDLFSDTAEKTIADKFGNSNDSSIAKRMQQSQIEDLRQAIGINEKFLFINGLFNGDLSRYNKAIDEFNELTTAEGVNTHFLELKIQNQWSDDNDGAVKLKALLDRKFN